MDGRRVPFLPELEVLQAVHNVRGKRGRTMPFSAAWYGFETGDGMLDAPGGI